MIRREQSRKLQRGTAETNLQCFVASLDTFGRLGCADFIIFVERDWFLGGSGDRLPLVAKSQ